MLGLTWPEPEFSNPNPTQIQIYQPAWARFKPEIKNITLNVEEKKFYSFKVHQLQLQKAVFMPSRTQSN